MRIPLLVLLGAIVCAAAPATAHAQRPNDGDLRSRVRGILKDRDAAERRDDRRDDRDYRRDDRDDRRDDRDYRRDGRDGRWDWDRGRDDRRDRGYDRGWNWKDDWKVYQREQRDFDRRARRWNRWQWEAYRACERDLWRRSRWHQNERRREVLFERRRIRSYCESRVSRW